MARGFKLIFALCLIAVCLATDGGSGDQATESPSPPTGGSVTDSPSPPTGGSATDLPSPPTESPATDSPQPPTGSPASNSPQPPTGSPASNSPQPPTGSPASNSPQPPTGSPASNSPQPPTGGPDTNSTQPPTGGPATVPPAETTQPPTQPLNPCVPNPCGKGSTCEPRANETFVCLCLPGESYNNATKSCENAKVFPGALSLPELKYENDMSDTTSAKFLQTAGEIIDELNRVFENKNGYSESTVLKIEPLSSTRVWSRSGDGVKATVEIIFKANADIKSDQIIEDIKSFVSNTEGILKGGDFKEANLCIKGPCDSISTVCSSGDGSFTCTCKDVYVPTEFSDRVCTACPEGKKAEGSTCVNCPFGYSGFNCEESWQQTLVIVGSVLGGLLLITLILLPIVACKSSKKRSKINKDADIKKPYESRSLTEAPLVHSSSTKSQSVFGNGSAFANAGVPRIPRAAPASRWDSRNDLEMNRSNSPQNLVHGGRNPHLYEDPDNVAPYGRPQPQINPYAQNRPQINPYASSQGQINHSYLHDNGRRFN